MVNNYTVICSKDNIRDDKELILSIQKAMLITLFETEKINMAQYTNAARLLEKKFMEHQKLIKQEIISAVMLNHKFVMKILCLSFKK